MSSTYHQLLDATIQHLEGLKARGVRHVTVAPETLRALAQLPVKQSSIARPAASGAPVSDPARGKVPKHAGPEAGAPQATAEQASLLALPGEPVPAPAPALDPQAKAAAFAALRERALACV